MQDSQATAKKDLASCLEAVVKNTAQASSSNLEVMKQVSSILERQVAQLRSKIEAFEAKLTPSQYHGATAETLDTSSSMVPGGEATFDTMAGSAVITGDVLEVTATPLAGSGHGGDDPSDERSSDEWDHDSTSGCSMYEAPAVNAAGSRGPSDGSGLLSDCQDAVLSVSPPKGWVSRQPRVGDTVLISDLVQATHYNSKSGEIVQETDDAGRVAVRFGPSRPPVRIRLQNVFFPAFCPFCSAEVTSGHCMACKKGSHMILHDTCTSKLPLPGNSRTPNTFSMTHKDINNAASSTPALALAAVKGTSSQLQAKYSSHSSHDT